MAGCRMVAPHQAGAPVQTDLPTYSSVTVAGSAHRTFRCEPHDLVLTDHGCADRWKLAQGAGGFGRYAKAVTVRKQAVTHVRRYEHGFDQVGARKVRALAANRLDATSAHAASLQICARCPLGALHAGCAPITRSPHFGSDQCPRCGFGTSRMIQGRVCVSCYNREREVAAGRNGRGNRPKHLAPLHLVAILVAVDGQPFRRIDDRATTTVEVMCRQLRTAKGAVAFAPRRRGADVAMQGRLFA